MSRDDSTELLTLADRIAERAHSAGADVAEVSVGAGWELSVRVRLGETELVEEAGTRGASLRVIRGDRVAVSSTSDLSDSGLERLVRDAIELSALTEADPFAAPAELELLASGPWPELELRDGSVDAIDAGTAIELARRAEAAALAHDPRITLSEGGSVSRASSTSAMVLARDGVARFRGATAGSYVSIAVSPVAADEGDKKRRGSYWSATRHLKDLEAADAVGIEAARRTIRKLGARKVETTEAPVIFDPDAARSIIGTFAGCILGGAIWRKSSYLCERERTPVASSLITIIDDPLLPRGFGSRPFDGEGLPSRRMNVVTEGTLETFLLDCYSARKLGRTSTGHARRGGGTIGASTTNFIMQPGAISQAELIRSTERGLFVTEMMGFGFNAVTGDFSRGAAGFWIENGELAFPVSEITISGNLDTMLKQVDAVANDLELKSSTAAPSFRVSTMTIGGR